MCTIQSGAPKGNTKIIIAPSVDKGRILIRILVTCPHLQRTNNNIHEGHTGYNQDDSVTLWLQEVTNRLIYTREMAYVYIIFRTEDGDTCAKNAKYLSAP